MVKIRFPNPESERKAIGYLAGRFSFKSFADGTTLMPQVAISRLASERIEFTVEGRATYEQYISEICHSSAASIQ